MTAAVVLFCMGLWSSSLAAQVVERCISDVEEVSSIWRQLEYGDERKGQTGAPIRRVGPDHTGPHVEYMRNQLRLALRQCQEGNTEEAQLRIALIRSWLKLPELKR